MRRIDPQDLVRWPNGDLCFVKHLTKAQIYEGQYEVVTQDSPEYDLLMEELTDAENARLLVL